MLSAISTAATRSSPELSSRAIAPVNAGSLDAPAMTLTLAILAS
jgi:hypothetical protein